MEHLQHSIILLQVPKFSRRLIYSIFQTNQRSRRQSRELSIIFPWYICMFDHIFSASPFQSKSYGYVDSWNKVKPPSLPPHLSNWRTFDLLYSHWWNDSPYNCVRPSEQLFLHLAQCRSIWKVIMAGFLRWFLFLHLFSKIILEELQTKDIR